MAKSGPKDVNPSSKGSSPSGGVPGAPGRSPGPQRYAGPASSGPPASMRKALAKKSLRGGNATGYAGSLKPNARA